MNCPGCNALLDSRATFCATCGRSVPDPFLGAVIAGRYQLERRIAIGGFGSIYRGVWLHRERPVALKIMHRELAADTNLVARFRREGEVLLKLKDRHTVETFEVGETPEGLPFIAMELLEGDTLLRLFHLHGRMPWQRVFGIIRAMCSSLAEAHGLGFVHRDLKPGNIFLTTDDVVKVLDFGIARIMSNSELVNPQELTVMGTAVGTVEYMAPEQLMGGKADARTDLYTVGVLAYELISGRRPFNAQGLDLLTVQLTEQPAPLSQTIDVPPIVDEIVLRCLAQDPADRFADARELAVALDGAVTSQVRALPLPAPPMSVPIQRPVLAEAPRRPQRLPHAVIALAIGALAIGIGAALGWLT